MTDIDVTRVRQIYDKYEPKLMPYRASGYIDGHPIIYVLKDDLKELFDILDKQIAEQQMRKEK